MGGVQHGRGGDAALPGEQLEQHPAIELLAPLARHLVGARLAGSGRPHLPLLAAATRRRGRNGSWRPAGGAKGAPAPAPSGRRHGVECLSPERRSALNSLLRCAAGALLLPALLALPAWRAGAHLDPFGDGELALLFREGRELESREELLESSRRYERIAEREPGSAWIRWRLARNYWRHAERLPQHDKRGRLHFFEVSERWADAGLAVDERCGECVFWKAASLGRLATTRGAVQSAAAASTIAELIERGIALRPTHRDGPRNVTLANLYYAGSAFYRIVPDWWWLRMVIGVRGDNHRALQYIDRAIAISSERVDYHVERGAVLLCIGVEEDDAERIAEGRAALAAALEVSDYQSTDAFDRAHARVLIEEPERACGYSRDGWIDLAEAMGARP